ncbi:MAG: isoprenylcysteine carboxylmethyltransferase family protein [Pseudomonadota bacterium]
MVGRVVRFVDLPPMWTIVAMAGCLLLSRYEAPFADSNYLRVSGGVVMAIALFVMLWAVRHLMRADTAVMPHSRPRTLVRSGPYKFSRNPIYVADLALVIGFAVACGQPLGALLALPLAVVLLQRFIRPEEAVLEREFEAQFRAWRAEIPRWL